MRIAAVIPARFNSQRFPGKPLCNIAGMTMIERVFRQVQKAENIADIIVGTDDSRILNEVFRFGGKAVMTSESINSGTERVWEVLKNIKYDAAINIQADEPLISPQLISAIALSLKKHKFDIVSAIYLNSSYEDFLSPNVVKVVISKKKSALFFSRSPIPYTNENNFSDFFQHIGIYGYHKDALQSFISQPQSELECQEKLEQLRFLENGQSVGLIVSEYFSCAVDVPDDVKKIERILEKEK